MLPPTDDAHASDLKLEEVKVIVRIELQPAREEAPDPKPIVSGGVALSDLDRGRFATATPA
jgi:hypothetical protein